MEKKGDEYLKSVYYDPAQGLQSATKIYERVKRKGYSLKDVKDFIRKQELAQVSFQPKKPVYIGIIGKPNCYQQDLTFYPDYGGHNKGYTIIYTIININSRKAYAYPLKNKTRIRMLKRKWIPAALRTSA